MSRGGESDEHNGPRLQVAIRLPFGKGFRDHLQETLEYRIFFLTADSLQNKDEEIGNKRIITLEYFYCSRVKDKRWNCVGRRLLWSRPIVGTAVQRNFCRNRVPPSSILPNVNV